MQFIGKLPHMVTRLFRTFLILFAAATVTLAPVQIAHAQPVIAQNFDSEPGQDPVTREDPEDSSVLEYVNNGYRFFAVVGGLVAVMMLIYAGYRYMTSYGDPEKISDAKDIVEKTLVGLGLLILAAVILNTVNPRTGEDLCTGHGGAECGTIYFTQPNGQ